MNAPTQPASQVLPPTPDAKTGAEALARAVKDWYDRDGSVGGMEVLMEEVIEPALKAATPRAPESACHSNFEPTGAKLESAAPAKREGVAEDRRLTPELDRVKWMILRKTEPSFSEVWHASAQATRTRCADEIEAWMIKSRLPVDLRNDLTALVKSWRGNEEAKTS